MVVKNEFLIITNRPQAALMMDLAREEENRKKQ
jgi:hypothetical protein